MDGGDAYSTHPHVLSPTAQSRIRGGPATSSWRGGATMNEDGSPLLRKLVAPCTAPGRGVEGRGKGGGKTISSGRHSLEWLCSERSNAATYVVHAGRQAVIDIPQWLQGRLRETTTS